MYPPIRTSKTFLRKKKLFFFWSCVNVYFMEGLYSKM